MQSTRKTNSTYEIEKDLQNMLLFPLQIVAKLQIILGAEEQQVIFFRSCSFKVI